MKTYQKCILGLSAIIGSYQINAQKTQPIENNQEIENVTTIFANIQGDQRDELIIATGRGKIYVLQSESKRNRKTLMTETYYSNPRLAGTFPTNYLPKEK